MPNTINSANMSLPVPVVGTDPGPQFAIDINSCLALIDAHDHSSGKGVQITPDGLNITADLPINGNNLITVRTLRLSNQAAALDTAADIGCVYEVAGDLYYNDSNGNQIQITQNGGIAGSPGSISNLTAPASASYVAANSKFVWESDINTAADMDMRNAILRNSTASSNGLTLSPPAAMGSDITITLPSLPASTAVLLMDTSGNITASPTQYAAFAPVGAMMMFGGTVAPTGWLMMDGSAVSRATYSALFAVIGTTYGIGNGSTTFNVPNQPGRMPIGAGTGSGLTNRALGSTGGSETHQLTAAESGLPDHYHFEQYNSATLAGNTGPTTTHYMADPNFHPQNAIYPTSTVAGGAQNAASAHAIMNPWLAHNFIIKY